MPSYPGLFCEFKFFISVSTSNLVTGLIKKLFLHLLDKYSLKALLVVGSLLAIPGPTLIKYSLNLLAISWGFFYNIFWVISTKFFR